MIDRITVRRDEVVVDSTGEKGLAEADLEAAHRFTVNVARLMGWAKVGQRVEAELADVVGDG